MAHLPKPNSNKKGSKTRNLNNKFNLFGNKNVNNVILGFVLIFVSFLLESHNLLLALKGIGTLFIIWVIFAILIWFSRKPNGIKEKNSNSSNKNIENDVNDLNVSCQKTDDDEKQNANDQYKTQDKSGKLMSVCIGCIGIGFLTTAGEKLCNQLITKVNELYSSLQGCSCPIDKISYTILFVGLAFIIIPVIADIINDCLEYFFEYFNHK